MSEFRKLVATPIATPIATCLLCCGIGSAAGVHGQVAPVPDASTTVQVGQAANATVGTVLLLLPTELPEALRNELVDAVQAQLTGSGANLVWELLTAGDGNLGARIEATRPLVAKHGASGAFWLEVGDSGDGLLYLMDAGGQRVLVRPVAAVAGPSTASLDLVAVIVRQAALALIAGDPIAMDTVASPPGQPPPNPASPPPTPAVPATTDRSAERPTTSGPDAPSPTPPIAVNAAGPLRFAIGYAGTPLATEVPWQHGLLLRAHLLVDDLWIVGLSFTLLPSAEVADPTTRLTVHRRPLRLHGGARVELGRRVSLDVEANLLADVTRRTADATGDDTAPTADATAWVFGGGLGVRLQFAPQPNVELFVGAGVDVFLNRFDYVRTQDGTKTTLLAPWPVSPTVEAGVAFRP